MPQCHKFLPSIFPQVIALGLSLPVVAENNLRLEEVVVTAQKRSESTQDIPIAISAYNNHTLELKGANDFAKLATTLPALNFSVYPSSSDALIMYMRGQGVNDVGQITREGAVGVYIDGVYMVRPQSVTMDLADIERVEVLRGPQGTLYGRNTTGGAVNIITEKPAGELGFKQSLSIGNRDYWRSLSVVELPEMAGIATKFSYVSSDKDGYVDNIGGSPDYGENRQQGFRFSARADLTDQFSIDYAFENTELESSPIYYQNDLLASPTYSTFPHTKTPRAADMELGDTETTGHTLTLDWSISEKLTLKSISHYSELESVYSQDYMDAAFVYSYYTSMDDIKSRQFSQEIQLVGNALDQRLEYVAGLYYFSDSASHAQTLGLLDLQDNFDPGNNIPSPLNLRYHRYVTTDNESSAVYGQGAYTPPVLDDRLTFILGVRYTEDTRAGVRDLSAEVLEYGSTFPVDVDVEKSVSYESFDPALSIQHQWTDDITGYAKISTAYKSGGLAESSADFTIAYDPEEITSYELGIKSYWLDRRLRLNAAVFLSDYQNMQLDLSPDPTQIQVVNTYNAGSAEIRGFELDVLMQLTQNLQIGVDYAFLDWTIEEVLNPANGSDITNQFSLPYTPRHAYNIALNYTIDTPANSQTDFYIAYSWQDETYMSASTTADKTVKGFWTRDDYGVVNARLSIGFNEVYNGSLRLALWANNLIDTEYEAHRFTAGIGSAVAWNEPRTYGLDIIFEY
ncbi:TonB-dependent receptor [Parahaliea mediterranea]|uniref:TonB-dependent receptor n=1 Tax=Parahaliea mediterranea TaxID=651086 RepID=A0A939DEH4_9GAMM|nr:TonB-dependent receptor [Parahaliea mediterranea]MBN7796663.1 TonB-dependent receptor [Parahaliea mediterranea]